MPVIDFSGLVSELAKIKDKRVMLTFHSIGDTDSLSSAIALSCIFKNSTIAAPDRLTRNAMRIMQKLGYGEGMVSYTFPSGMDAVIMLDVNNFEGCGGFRHELNGFGGKIIVIDHHKHVEDRQNMLIFSDESFNSAAGIVYQLLKGFGTRIGGALAELISIGIISDSAEFRNANSLAFEQLGELFRIAGTDYITLVAKLGHISPPEERLKTVSDIINSRAFMSNGLLFMEGECHAYANLAADSAIRIGADVALFYSIGGEVSFSARLRPTLDKKYGIHMGEMMKELAPIIKGAGGGHPCAAGAYGPGGDVRMFVSGFMDGLAKKTAGKV